MRCGQHRFQHDSKLSGVFIESDVVFEAEFFQSQVTSFPEFVFVRPGLFCESTLQRANYGIYVFSPCLRLYFGSKFIAYLAHLPDLPCCDN
jgi:hypothetical protein